MIDLQQSDYMRTLETAIQFGLPVLLQNVQEKLDPSLDPVLTKSLMKIGQCRTISAWLYWRCVSSLVTVVSHQGGLSSGWFLLSSGLSFLSSMWSLVRVISHQSGLSSG